MITLGDTRAAGMTPRQVERLVECGKWRREYRGVFVDNAVPITPMQPVIAAAEAVGRRSLASHRLSTWVWQFTHERNAPALEFTVAGRNPRPPGITVYRVRELPQVSHWRGIRLTSPLRALVDFAAVEPEGVGEPLLNALLSGRLTPAAVRAEIERGKAARRKGVAALRRALSELGVGRYTPSQLETKARRLFRELGLPDPRVEVVFGEHGEYRLDFYWPEADLVVEVDGWSVHAIPLARRRDFKKQNRIVMSDKWVLRYDWFQVVHDADATAAEVLEAYRARTGLLR